MNQEIILRIRSA